MTERAYYTIEEVCQRWGVTRKTIYKWEGAGLLVIWRAAPRVPRVSLEEVRRFECASRIVTLRHPA